MRIIPDGLQAALDSGVTTFCHCWLIEPVGLPPLGFTDHDEDLSFDDVVFEASSGFSAAAIERSLGLSIDNTSVKSALRSGRISERDISMGRYDGARIKIWLVDWSAPENRLLSFAGELGDITHSEAAFEAEIRGLSETLNRPVGRRFLPVCDAEPGDERCGISPDDPRFRAEGAVEAVDEGGRSFSVSGLGAFETHWFSSGRLTWSDGVSAGMTMRIHAHYRRGDAVILEPEHALHDELTGGETFTIFAGCDKRLSTCRRKFANVRNFRGFPYLPGDNWLTAYPVSGRAYDGGKRNAS